MKELKELTIDQVKSWKLSTNQLKKQIQVELRKAEQLKAELNAAKSFTNIISFDSIVDYSEESLIDSLISLRKKNIETQTKILKKEALNKKNEKTASSDLHDKYARVMKNVSHAADLRELWDSDDVLSIDDYVAENGVSYDEAMRAIQEKKTTSKPLSDEE